MKKEIDPKESPRGRAFELWKTAGMPKVTIVKTFDVGRLVRVAKRNGMKTNMLMCWCIGQAASGIQEFYTLPVGEHLCQFNEDYLRLTRQVHETNEDHLLGDDYMAIDTSALAECEIDGVVSVYSELFTNPFLAWGKYHQGLFKTTLPISFQFHHAQMDGFEAARFLNGLQEVINNLS